MKLSSLNRIEFRDVEPSDYNLIFKWENDPENWLQSGVEKPYTSEEIKQYVSKKETLLIERQTRKIIIGKSDDSVIGALDLFKYDPNNNVVSIGILIDKSFRNQGYASESILKIESFCIDQFNIKSINCLILKSNKISLKLFKSIGYKEVSGQEKAYYYLGKYYDQFFLKKVM